MNKKQMVKLVISLAVLVAFLLLTNPYKLPLLLLFLPGIATLILAYYTISIATKKARLSPTLRKIVIAVSLSVLSVTGVLLSLGQFTPRDFVLLLSFTLLGLFYVYRMWNTD